MVGMQSRGSLRDAIGDQFLGRTNVAGKRRLRLPCCYGLHGDIAYGPGGESTWTKSSSSAAPTAQVKPLRHSCWCRSALEFASSLTPTKSPAGFRRSTRNMRLLRRDGSCSKRMRELIKARQSFAFETTCSGRTHLPMLKRCKADGWRLTLIYLWLPSPQAALERVARRVQQGGHNIPSDVVVRRYWTGLSNMRLLYLPLADVAAIYDNSDSCRTLVAEQLRGALIVRDADRWAAIERAKQ
jgi:predicted ABC-type ATPase